MRLDFSTLRAFESEEQFERDLSSLILAAFEPLGFQYRGNTIISFMDQLKTWVLSLEDASLVLLIDEYDTPLTEHLDDPKAFEHIQNWLGTFYAVLKQADGCLCFAFMTGITKFSSTGIFSGFNNFTDLSLDPAYGELQGYTEEEIECAFPGYLRRAAQALDLSENELLSMLKLSYDGFSFDEKASAHVYSPWSVLNFLDRPERGFKNY